MSIDTTLVNGVWGMVYGKKKYHFFPDYKPRTSCDKFMQIGMADQVKYGDIKPEECCKACLRKLNAVVIRIKEERFNSAVISLRRLYEYGREKKDEDIILRTTEIADLLGMELLV